MFLAIKQFKEYFCYPNELQDLLSSNELKFIGFKFVPLVCGTAFICVLKSQGPSPGSIFYIYNVLSLFD